MIKALAHERGVGEAGGCGQVVLGHGVRGTRLLGTGNVGQPIGVVHGSRCLLSPVSSRGITAYPTTAGAQFLISSTPPIPSSVSRAWKPSTSVLSTSGIRNDDAVQRVNAPAAQEVHDVRALLRSSRINEIALATGLHEHAVALANVDKAYGKRARRRRAGTTPGTASE